MGMRRRLRKIVVWGTLVLLASLSGGLWFAYVYVTDSDTLAGLVRKHAPKFLPGSRVDVGRARVRPFAGEVHLTQIAINQTLDGGRFLVARIPWLSIRHDTRAMFDGKFEPTEVVVAQPTLRLRRRKDGTWNLQGLLADPWPGPVMKAPPILIQNGTLELTDADAPPNAPGAAILRDVSVKVESAGPGKLAFEGTAKGDTFDRISIKGTVEITTGRLEFTGDMARLQITETLRSRLPADLRPAVDELGLTGGEVDLRIGRLTVDPKAPPANRLRYELAGRLRSGVWNCPKLPFPINDLTMGFALNNSSLKIQRAEGFYGTTTIRVEQAQVGLGVDPARMPFSITMDVIDLELDENLRRWTPPQFAPLWEEFRPSGRVSMGLTASRQAEGGPVRHRLVVDCDGVAGLYKHFKYPVDQVRGRFVWEGDRVTVVGLHTLVGGQPLSATGTIDHPGPKAVVALTFVGQALPVDKTLFDALPPDVRKVVDEFKPTGTVRGTVHLRRWPPSGPKDPILGKVAIDAYLDLNERCGITWVGLPYPVNNLTGRLELHPDVWEFKNMRGTNGQAVLTGSGRVEKMPGPGEKFKVDLHLNAEKLPFDQQLRDALPPAWKKSWAILEPTGSSDVDATIHVAPGKPDSYVLVVTPRPATDVRLTYSREPKPGIDPGGTFELRLEDVTGRFVFNNGPVDMTDVGFRFHGAPVQFERGRVIVEDSGKFQLGAGGLWVKEIRLDHRLRSIMPPVMAQFAQRFDDGRTFTLKGNLALGWSGLPNESVVCAWDSGLVIFNGNAIQIQPGLALEEIQGQLDHVRGRADGESFEAHGALALESVSVLGQQVLRLETPIDVERGFARLDNLRGTLLGGEVAGKFSVSLDSTPKYAASLQVNGADLQQYARTLPGRQTFRGRVDARLDLNGFGGDLRTLQGAGEARIVNGDLGELPVFLRIFKLMNLSPATKTAFDTADVRMTVQNGKAYFDPIRFFGDAFSLHGRGTMDVQGDLDLRLRPLAGRDRLHVRFFSDMVREASGQLMVIAVRGTPSYPKFSLEPLPEVTDSLRSLGLRRGERAEDRRR